jgi:hypothetical protein
MRPPWPLLLSLCCFQLCLDCARVSATPPIYTRCAHSLSALSGFSFRARPTQCCSPRCAPPRKSREGGGPLSKTTTNIVAIRMIQKHKPHPRSIYNITCTHIVCTHAAISVVKKNPPPRHPSAVPLNNKLPARPLDGCCSIKISSPLKPNRPQPHQPTLCMQSCQLILGGQKGLHSEMRFIVFLHVV